MKTYSAIGHFKGNKNITSVVMRCANKKEFMKNLYGNSFVAYVVLTEEMVEKLSDKDGMEIYIQVKKLTTNYRVWNDVTDYIEQCLDIIKDRMKKEERQ